MKSLKREVAFSFTKDRKSYLCIPLRKKKNEQRKYKGPTVTLLNPFFFSTTNGQHPVTILWCWFFLKAGASSIFISFFFLFFTCGKIRPMNMYFLMNHCLLILSLTFIELRHHGAFLKGPLCIGEFWILMCAILLVWCWENRTPLKCWNVGSLFTNLSSENIY